MAHEIHTDHPHVHDVHGHAHDTHTDHPHVHGEHCGHHRVPHEGHIDYLHDGHLHAHHEDHYDEHAIPVNATNPDRCAPLVCTGDHESQLAVPHGDHTDRVVGGYLHHRHGDHCDDHGPVTVL